MCYLAALITACSQQFAVELSEKKKKKSNPKRFPWLAVCEEAAELLWGGLGASPQLCGNLGKSFVRNTIRHGIVHGIFLLNFLI